MPETNARVINEPQWPNGGFALRNVSDNQYDVNQFGAPVSIQPAAGWIRGDIMRGYSVGLRPSGLGLEAYDVTDPSTWIPNV